MTPPTTVMPSCFDLTADPDYHIQELLAEAEHDRLVSRCTAESVSSHAGGLRLRRLVLLSVAAGVLYVGAARVLGALVAVVAASERRARAEERLLVETFGEGYRAYLRRVRRWIPGLY